MTTDVRVALVTGPDADTLRTVCRTLVEERLIACANILHGAESIYRWEGSVEESRESVAILKTTTDRLSDLESRVQSLHPYDVPEFVVLAVESGLNAYLDWVRDSTRPI